MYSKGLNNRPRCNKPSGVLNKPSGGTQCQPSGGSNKPSGVQALLFTIFLTMYEITQCTMHGVTISGAQLSKCESGVWHFLDFSDRFDRKSPKKVKRHFLAN